MSDEELCHSHADQQPRTASPEATCLSRRPVDGLFRAESVPHRLTGRAWRPSSGRGLAAMPAGGGESRIAPLRAKGVARDELVDAGRQRVRGRERGHVRGLMAMVKTVPPHADRQTVRKHRWAVLRRRDLQKTQRPYGPLPPAPTHISQNRPKKPEHKENES